MTRCIYKMQLIILKHLEEIINEKELSLKNANDLLKGRQWVTNAFEGNISNILMNLA